VRAEVMRGESQIVKKVLIQRIVHKKSISRLKRYWCAYKDDSLEVVL
jgi:hypothetical protein